MIVLKEIGEPIRSIGAERQRDDICQAEISYCIGRRWWHKGIMREVLAAVIDFLFAEVGMKRIQAKDDTNNPHSGGVIS